MERLGTIVHRVLAGLTVTNEEEMAGDREGPRQLAEAGGGGEAPRLAKGRAAARGAHGSHHIAAEKTPKTPALNAAVRR